MNNRVISSLILLIIVGIGILSILPKVEAQPPPYTGPYVGEVMFIMEPDLPLATEKLIAGEYDILFNEIGTVELFERIRNAGMAYSPSYGLYYEITLNYACKTDEAGNIIEPVFPNPSKNPYTRDKILFNPFCNRKLRQAVHFLIDREYIATGIMGGLGIARYTAITPAFPDYGRYADVILAIERELAYNFDKARRIIFDEMIKMGAIYKDGKWYYKGEPVLLIFLIRTEDVRKDIGDYVSSQLEKLGFTVIRHYGTSGALAPYWIRADPYDGTFHLYTGGWITTIVSRDQGGNFAYFYTKMGRPELLWQRIINLPEFYDVADRLSYKKFTTLEERRQLFEKALWLSVIEENQRIFIIHRVSYWPRNPNVILAADLAGGYSGSWLWPWTIRFTNIPKWENKNKTVKIAINNLLVEPWNPIGGSNWIFDQTVIRATGELPYYYDPYSGLTWPHMIKKAEVYVQEDLPVFKALPWIELYKVPELTVPDDAWLLYDCRSKKIWTVSEAKQNPAIIGELFNLTYDFTLAPLAKTIVYYDERITTGAYKWHDGSPFSVADLVYAFIITFDRVCINSTLYDAAATPSFTAWFPTFRGFKILQTNPLIIEYYTRVWYMDAEWIASAAAGAFWPYYSQGPGAWHTVEVFAQGERAGITAFTSAKATLLGLPKNADYLSPPPGISDILETNINTSYVPYPEVLGTYITSTEARERWINLKNWYNTYGHYWVGNGPFYLEKYTTAPTTITLKAYREHIDSAAKWEFLGEPPIPVIYFTPPEKVTKGEEVTIKVLLTDKEGNPYPDELMDFVSFVIIHAKGIASGRAELIGNGEWSITLSAALTDELPAGLAEMRVIAVSKVVGIPSVESKTFLVITPIEKIGKELDELRARLQQQAEELERLRIQLMEQLEEMSAGLGELLGTAVATAFEALASQINITFTGIQTMLGTITEGMGTISGGLSSLADALGATRSEMRTEITKLSSDLKDTEGRLSEEINTVRQDVTSLSTVVYATIGLVAVNLVIALIGMFIKKK